MSSRFPNSLAEVWGPYSGWELDEKVRSAAWRAEQLHRSGEGADAIAEAGQPGAAPVGASYTVVPHNQVEELPALLY
jgi:hypothetical protein